MKLEIEKHTGITIASDHSTLNNISDVTDPPSAYAESNVSTISSSTEGDYYKGKTNTFEGHTKNKRSLVEKKRIKEAIVDC